MDRKFEVGADYKMCVSRWIWLSRRGTRVEAENRLLRGCLRRRRTQADWGALVTLNSMDVVGEGAYGVVWCVSSRAHIPRQLRSFFSNSSAVHLPTQSKVAIKKISPFDHSSASWALLASSGTS